MFQLILCCSNRLRLALPLPGLGVRFPLTTGSKNALMVFWASKDKKHLPNSVCNYVYVVLFFGLGLVFITLANHTAVIIFYSLSYLQ